jgi:ribonuclease VapC
LIVVDASALVAVAMGEDEAERFSAILSLSSAAVITEVNYMEVGIVLAGRAIIPSAEALDDWLRLHGVETYLDADLGPAALSAYLRFGRGYHPARLNLGDCFAYALARKLDAPLLYKGEDFPLTDVRAAVQP